MKNKNDIKLIATDLDGTLLDSGMGLSEKNKQSLERAAEMGVILVIATGRSYRSIPNYVKEIKGLKYAVTANGSKIHDFETSKLLYDQYISESAIDDVWDVLNTKGIMLEVFVDGRPYVHNWDYVNPQIFGVSDSFMKYFMASRKPVEDIFQFIKEHKSKIENINLVFRSPQERLDALSTLEAIISKNNSFSLTSSFAFNLEVGGLYVNKGEAIHKLCEMNQLSRENVMCLGDNSNDKEMVEYAGIGVAMSDAVSDVKDVADFVTKSSSESGVAFAVEKFVL